MGYLLSQIKLLAEVVGVLRDTHESAPEITYQIANGLQLDPVVLQVLESIRKADMMETQMSGELQDALTQLREFELVENTLADRLEGLGGGVAGGARGAIGGR